MKTARPTIAVAALALVLAGCSTGGQDAVETTSAESASASESTTAPERAAPTAVDPTTPADEDPDADLEGEQTLPWGDGETLVIDMDGTEFGPGSTWYGQAETGGVFLVEAGVPEPDDLKAFREAAGGAPVGYMKVDVDNRQGTDGMNMYGIDIFDASGQKYTYSLMGTQIDTWGGGNYDQEHVDLYDKYYIAAGASVHERDQNTYLVGPSVPDNFVAMTVSPSGAFGTTEAVPVAKR